MVGAVYSHGGRCLCPPGPPSPPQTASYAAEIQQYVAGAVPALAAAISAMEVQHQRVQVLVRASSLTAPARSDARRRSSATRDESGERVLHDDDETFLNEQLGRMPEDDDLEGAPDPDAAAPGPAAEVPATCLHNPVRRWSSQTFCDCLFPHSRQPSPPFAACDRDISGTARLP